MGPGDLGRSPYSWMRGRLINAENLETSLIERVTQRGAAAQHSGLLLWPVGAGVQAGEVVPHHQITGLPDVLVDDRRVLGDVEQLGKNFFAFVPFHAFNPHGIET